MNRRKIQEVTGIPIEDHATGFLLLTTLVLSSLGSLPVLTSGCASIPVSSAVASVSCTVTWTITDSKTGRPVLGVDIYLDGRWVGRTDSQGKIVIRGITPGCHTLMAKSPDYRNRVTREICCGSQVTYRLTVIVTSQGRAVSGATVYLDTKRIGVTDGAGRLVIAGVTRGTHTIVVNKAGYRQVSQRVTVSSDMTVIIRL